MAEIAFIDLLRWGAGGTQTYARSVARRLHARHENIWLICDEPGRKDLFPGVERPERVICAGFDGRSLVRRYWYQHHDLPRRLRALGATTYFVPGESTGFPTPQPGIRTVRMLRNMLPLEPAEVSRCVLHRYPFTRLRDALIRLAIHRGLPRADRTIFISEYSRTVLSRSLTLRDTVLIRHGIESPLAGSAAPGEKGSPKRPYVLYVSATFPYKHHLELIEAHELAATRNSSLPELVLAGPLLGYYGRLVRDRAARSSAKVRVLGEVDGATARALMSSAEALLFGSTCECCPNLLEYLAAGRPVLSSSVGPMPEIGGDAVVYSDPTRPAVWAADLLRLLQDRPLANDMVHRASERVKQFALDRVVENTYHALTSW